MNESIEVLIDDLESTLDKGVKLPGKKYIVDYESMSAIIDDIRFNMPNEIKQARGIVSDRNQILNEAKMEADRLIRAAEEKSKQLCSQEEITRLAQQKASETISNAQSSAAEMRNAVNSYVSDILTKCEETLQNATADVHKTKMNFEAQSGNYNKAE